MLLGDINELCYETTGDKFYLRCRGGYTISRFSDAKVRFWFCYIRSKR